MLRKDREVTNKEEILDILRRCDTLRVAMQGGEYPYIVPVSFGMKEEGETVALYFHGAKRGYKAELIGQSPKVCVEADILHRIEELPHGITARYESVIGVGRIEKAEGEEIVEGLRAICEHYGCPAYPVESCKSLPATAVYKIRLESLTGKRNLPDFA